MVTELLIPFVNPNELEVKIVQVHVHEGMYIQRGDKICVLETTKATMEMTSEKDGYCVGIKVKEGEIVRAGEVFGYITDSLEEWQNLRKENGNHKEHLLSQGYEESQGNNLRITKPALVLAKEHHINLDLLPKDELITTEYLHKYTLNQNQEFSLSINREEVRDNSIVIIGGGGHGKAVIELLRAIGTFHIVGILDDGIEPKKEILGVPVLGSVSSLKELSKLGLKYAVNAVGGISRMQNRKDIFDMITDAGLSNPPLIHPRAFIEPSSTISDGVQIFPLAYVGSLAKIGFGCIINTGAIVSHDCVLEDYVNLSPHATLAGEVHVGELTLIGMGATINLRVHIGRRSKSVTGQR
jgi:sugar O-acyltransferase (sialic acid O-acetyltransferase NeuD family)